MNNREIAVVGAGLAGLAAAVTLSERGNDVVLFEASDGVGGRVRTDAVDGYLLDRGFQILLTAYPVAQRMLDYSALDLRRFRAGSLVQLESGLALVGDPLRRYEDLVETVKAPVGSPIDKGRLLLWRRKVMAGAIDDVWKRGEVTTASRFDDLKFSDEFVDQFLRPLFSGITLDPALEVTSRFTEFVFRMLAEGFGAVPARGMGEMPKQLAARLPSSAISLDTPVAEVGERFVQTEAGERLDVDAVIVATDMDSAARLVGTPDFGWNGVTTWWFSADKAPFDDPLLMLDGTSSNVVNNVAVMSNVSPFYAPNGKALIAVSSPTAPTDATADDVTRVLTDWFGGEVSSWELLRADSIPNAQPRHLPGEAVPAPAKLDSGVYVAGDHRQNPSINGALQSGRAAARAVLSQATADKS